jgi:hypothetical protein
VRFPALGPISGDWGGGFDVGLAAQYAAARAEDGRGPRTALERIVPAHFGLDAPSALAEAIHLGRVPQRRLVELPPAVFAAAASDPVAAEIVDRLASEIVVLVQVALRRLELTGEPVEVLRVTGGGVATSGIGARLWRCPDGSYAHHLLDPATGRPAWTGLLSVTALSDSALEAETLAKAALLSGPVAARRLLRARGGLLVHDDGAVETIGTLPLRDRMRFRIALS